MPTPERKVSSAAQTLRTNFERMAGLIGILDEDSKRLQAVIADLKANQSAPDWEERYQKASKELKNFLPPRKFAHQWYVVMLVAFTETYLHDILVAAAEADPTLMVESKQTISYTEVTEASSVAELALSMRSRWARNFIDASGPSGWIDRLTRMGARGYPSDLGTNLEEVWGVRHVVVHAAGRATADFVARHPAFDAETGEQLDLHGDQILGYVSLMTNFVEPTDSYVIKRFPALAL